MCALRKEKKMGNISAFIVCFCLKRHQQLLLLLSSVRAAACVVGVWRHPLAKARTSSRSNRQGGGSIKYLNSKL